MVEEVIDAMAIAMVSPLVVIRTIFLPISMPDSYLNTGKQMLGTIADGVERGVLHHKARVLDHEDLERPLDDISSIIILNNYSS